MKLFFWLSTFRTLNFKAAPYQSIKFGCVPRSDHEPAKLYALSRGISTVLIVNRHEHEHTYQHFILLSNWANDSIKVVTQFRAQSIIENTPLIK